ncbi:MAG TPA: PAS domain S-box protein [Alphaproteobacteria bacterium]|nr:PAS domain S-box protein [Alphaproteobacteria bacterium]
MPLDHAEFIERQQKLDQKGQQKLNPHLKNLMISGGFTVSYIGGCIALAVILEIDKTTAVLAGLLFVITSILAFWAQRYFHSLKLQEKERRLIREVLEGSRGARLITDSADNAIYFNQRFEALCQEFGEPTLENLAQLFMQNADAYNLFEKLSEQARRGLTDSMELRSGEGAQERWFLLTAQPVAGWAGYVHWRVDDISKQRELDRSVREEREKLIDFTDNAPVGFFSVDETGRFIFVNATLARWLGNDIQSLLSTGYLHTYLEKPPIAAAPYDVIEKGGARQVAEVTMKGPGGKTFLASVNQAVVREGEGRVRTRGVVHDLTSEREMRQALQASEDRFQRFFDEAPLGVVLVAPDGKVGDCNAAFAGLLGSDVEKIEGVNLKDLISEEHRDDVLKAVSKIEQGRRLSVPMEIVLLGKDDKRVTVQMHARRFKQSDNIVLHFIDLTEQKTLEMQFVQSQKMQAIGQLAGGVAHDFNNLLTAIIGFCDLLLLRHKPGDPSFGDIMQIKQNSNRAANLVRQLLAFSRQQTLRPKIHDMTDILTEVSHLLRRLIGANIDLELMHGSNLGLVKVDLGQMEQVLINLAVNARDAMENGGQLTITTDNFENDKPIMRGDDEMPAGHWVSIAVEDTGCGISKENLSRIIEPFFTTKDVGQGTGLGLATVYGIIRQTGGFLDIESEVGKGTTFTIYLPRMSDEELSGEAEKDNKDGEEPTGDLTGTARILLVEDEDAVRTFSTRALMNKGYEVLAAENGQAALQLMSSQENKQIDLLITDVMMPDMDGPTLVQRMRQDSPELRIIFISGYTEDKLKDHMGKGISFLPKPFTLKQLAAKVKEALDA